MSIDPAEKLEQMKERLGLDFDLLVDADSSTIEAWGLLNEKQGAIPHPATVVVDREGVVRWMRIDVDYRQRPAAEDVVVAVRALPDAAGE